MTVVGFSGVSGADVPLKKALSSLASRLAALHGGVADALSFLKEANPRLMVFPIGTNVVEVGAESANVYFIAKGWACRHGTLSDGSRQILAFLIPGDITSATSMTSLSALRGVSAVTELHTYVFNKREITRLSQCHPALFFAWLEVAGAHIALLEEHLINLGRRNAYQRTLHLMLELWWRLREVKLADDEGFELPVTQGMLADAVGLTVVHTNRILKQLKRDCLVEFDYRTRRVEILQKDAAIAACGFDVGYLKSRGFDLDSVVDPKSANNREPRERKF